MADARAASAWDLRPPTVLSIDLFDTLLVRPHGRRVALARWADAVLPTLRAYRPTLTPEALLAARNQAIRRVIARRGPDRPDPEPRHRELLAETFVRLAHGPAPAELLDALADAEIDAQVDATEVDARLAAWIVRLSREGVRVIATSDMYLSSEQLWRVLRRHGVEGLCAMYASSDVGRTKFSGRLFRHVLACEGLRPEGLVHLGDHPISDVVSPRALGVRTRWVAAYTPLRALRHRAAPAHPADDAWRLGRETLGPALVTAMEMARQRALRAGVDLVLFVARDAELLLRVAERGASWGAPLRYVHLSRRATLAASMTALDHATATSLLSLRRDNQGVATLMEALALDPVAFEPALAESRWGPIDRPVRDPARDEALRALLESEGFQRAFCAQAERARGLLRRYLDACGYFRARSVALVDVGWRGTIQRSLTRAFAEDPSAPALRGMYLGRWDETASPWGDPSRAEGMLCDPGRTPSLSECAAFELSLLLEGVCRAREGTTLGYRETDGGEVEPVLSTASVARAMEIACEAVTAPMRAGVLAAADDERWRPRDPEARRGEVQRRLARLAFAPTHEELSLCAAVVHTEGALPWLWERAIPVALPSPWRSPGRWLSGMSAPWRGGYVAATGGPLASLLYAAARGALLRAPSGPRRAVQAALRAMARSI